MNIKLSKAKLKDSRFFYKLRNNVSNRKNFINSEKIDFSKHNKWFVNSIKREKNIFSKILINNNSRCGYLRLIKKPNSIDVSICKNKKFRKKNIASQALLLAEQKFSEGKNLTAIVKKNNVASKLLFLKVGYKIIKKEKNLLHMKKRINAIKIIDQIESIRGKNNTNWMNLLRLAYRKSPKESAIIMTRIYRDDAKISKLVKKLLKK